MDGSLGTLYVLPTRPGRFAVATRGSFESDQARWASAHYDQCSAGRWLVPDGITMLFEIVYPENRIVLDYGTLEDVVLLGGVLIDTGRPVGPRDPEFAAWPGPRVEVFDHSRLASAVAAPTRTNAEGFVVRYLGTGVPAGSMVTIKQEDYVCTSSSPG